MMKHIGKRLLIAGSMAMVLTLGCGGAETDYAEEREPGVLEEERAERPGEPPAGLEADRRTMTVTGCLSRDTGAPPARGERQAEMQHWVLDVTQEAGQPAAPAGKYHLMAQAGINLSEHVGHTVRVTGTVSSMGAGPATPEKEPAAGRATPGTQEPRSSTPGQPSMLMVTNLEHVSPTCQKETPPAR